MSSSDGSSSRDVDFFNLASGVRKIQKVSADTVLSLLEIADELNIKTDRPVLKLSPSSGSEFQSLESLETQIQQSIEFAAAVKEVAHQIKKRMQEG